MAFSGIIKKNGDVVWEFGIDSHEDLIAKAKLLDDGRSDEFARFEISPANKNYLEPDTWVFRVDQKVRPKWLDKGYETFCWDSHKQWLNKLNKILVKKPIIHPLNDIVPPKKITTNHIKLLKHWSSVEASVWSSVVASVGDSVGSSVWSSVVGSVWSSVWSSVGDSVGASVWDSVWSSVGSSVGASVGASVWDSVWAYYGTFFHLPRKSWKHTDKIKSKGYPFQAAVDLWMMGLVPSFDGKTWRLHGGKNATVLWEGKI